MTAIVNYDKMMNYVQNANNYASTIVDIHALRVFLCVWNVVEEERGMAPIISR